MSNPEFAFHITERTKCLIPKVNYNCLCIIVIVVNIALNECSLLSFHFYFVFVPLLFSVFDRFLILNSDLNDFFKY
jgi:hypothetical protein